MSLFVLLLAVGVGTGVVVVCGMILFEVRRRRIGRLAAPLMPGQHTLARVGMEANAPTSMGTTVMRPTIGLRLLSLGFTGFALYMIWGPIALSSAHDLNIALITTGLILYGAFYIGHYEVRYDGESLTAPNWLFVRQTHAWTDLDGIGMDGSLVYVLRFSARSSASELSAKARTAQADGDRDAMAVTGLLGGGAFSPRHSTVYVQKYLVGMPTFLTFVAEMKALTRTS